MRLPRSFRSAAHEDANIIFGAVLDEKMKDDVKITVIATGFKTDQPQRRERTVSAAAAAIHQQRTASSYVAPGPRITRPERVMEVNSRQEMEFEDEARMVAPPEYQQQAHASAQREDIELDSVKDKVKGNYEEDDLDVPAFIRKQRNEQK